MKYYYYNQSRPIEKRTRAPKEAHHVVPLGLINESSEWIDVVDDVNEFGVPIKKLEVNAAKKAAKVSERVTEKAARDAEKLTRKGKKDSDQLIIDKLGTLKRADISTAAERTDVLWDIIQLLKD